MFKGWTQYFSNNRQRRRFAYSRDMMGTTRSVTASVWAVGTARSHNWSSARRVAEMACQARTPQSYHAIHCMGCPMSYLTLCEQLATIGERHPRYQYYSMIWRARCQQCAFRWHLSLDRTRSYQGSTCSGCDADRMTCTPSKTMPITRPGPTRNMWRVLSYLT